MFTSEEIKLVVQNYLNSEDFTVVKCEETSDNRIEIEILIGNKEKRHVKFVNTQFNNYLQLEYANEKEVSNCKFSNVYLIPCYFTNKGNLYIPEEFYTSNSISKVKSFDFDEIKLVLESLAKYHSETISCQDNSNKEECKLKNNISQSYLFKALNSLIELLPDDNKLTHQQFKEDLSRRLKEIINSSNKFHQVLCHGYLCEDTVLFKCKKEVRTECKFLNFNQQHYNPPIYDVLQFIYMVTNMKFRKEYLNELLEFYYNCLKVNLHEKNIDIKNILPLEQDYEASINYFLPLIKVQTACIRLVQHLQPEFQKVCFENPDLFIEMFKTNENYKTLITNCLKDLKNLIINPGLTLEDIYKIVENKIGSKNYDLLDYELVPIGEVTGFFGEHNKLKVKISTNNKMEILNFFVKFTPKGEAQKSIAVDCGSFYKENFFYRHFVPKAKQFALALINDCTVPCYFTRLNDVLVFEDLNIQNYGILSHRQPLDFEVVELVVKQMAKLHASSIILEEKMSEETKSKYCLEERFKEGLEESFFTKKENHQGGKSIEISIAGIPHEIDLFPDNEAILSNEKFKKRIKKVYDAAYELVKPSAQFRNTLCHGDPWINNILIQRVDGKPTNCKLIDFQLMRYCPPAQDLLGFIYLATNRKFRQNHLDDILEIYYKEFSQSLGENGCDVEKIYSRSVFKKSIEYILPQVVGQTVIYYHICITNPELMSDYTADEAKMRQIFLEDRRDFVAEMCERDPIYKERNWEAIEDLREICAKYF